MEDKEGRSPSNNHPTAVTERKASGARPHTALTLKHTDMIELTIITMLVSYIAGIYVGRHWREFTQE